MLKMLLDAGGGIFFFSYLFCNMLFGTAHNESEIKMVVCFL